MPFRRPTTIESIVIAAFVLLVAALILSPGKGVFDGRFPLTVTIRETETEPIDRDSLLFATCWFEDEAASAISNPGAYEHGFRPPAFTADGRAVIDVPASGRTGRWGTVASYHHAEHLVVEYRLARADNAPPKRKRFRIPKGRGERSITIDLP